MIFRFLEPCFIGGEKSTRGKPNMKNVFGKTLFCPGARRFCPDAAAKGLYRTAAVWPSSMSVLKTYTALAFVVFAADLSKNPSLLALPHFGIALHCCSLFPPLHNPALVFPWSFKVLNSLVCQNTYHT